MPLPLPLALPSTLAPAQTPDAAAPPKPSAPTATAHAPPCPTRLLLVEADPRRRQRLAVLLSSLGHGVDATDQLAALARAPWQGYDLVLINPDTRPDTRPGPAQEDAWQALAQLRRHAPRLPVIVAQPGADAVDRTVALELGADMVLDPEAHPREWQARLLNLMQRRRDARPHRTGPADRPADGDGGWRLDPQTRQLQRPGDQPLLVLTRAECRLLQALLAHPGQVLPRERLLHLVPGLAADGQLRHIDLLVSRLRRKLDEDPRAPRHLRTVRGSGYRFCPLGEDEGEATATTPRAHVSVAQHDGDASFTSPPEHEGSTVAVPSPAAAPRPTQAVLNPF